MGWVKAINAHIRKERNETKRLVSTLHTVLNLPWNWKRRPWHQGVKLHALKYKTTAAAHIYPAKMITL